MACDDVRGERVATRLEQSNPVDDDVNCGARRRFVAQARNEEAVRLFGGAQQENVWRKIGVANHVECGAISFPAMYNAAHWVRFLRISGCGQDGLEDAMPFRKAAVRAAMQSALGDSARPPTASDYKVDIHPERIEEERYFATLRIWRTTDGKLIYPFDGCARSGPCRSAEAAKEAARVMADGLIRADVIATET